MLFVIRLLDFFTSVHLKKIISMKGFYHAQNIN